MSEQFIPTDSQNTAINELEGRLFIAAGAGSGKTSVVAHRFVEAIARGEAEVDQILMITFTKKAAAEMMKRVRDVLRKQMGQDEDPERVKRMWLAYRNIETAHISNNDSYYAQLLRANALAAGIDPQFTVADEARSKMLREKVFETALLDFVQRHGQAGADFIMAYDPTLSGNLFNDITNIYDILRSRGHAPRLPVPDPKEMLKRSCNRLLAAIEEFDEAVDRTNTENDTVNAIRETNWHLRGAVTAPELEVKEQLLLAGKPAAARGKVKEEIRQLQVACDNCLSALYSIKAANTLRLMSDLLETFDRDYSENKFEEGILDFADLSLFTRDLLVENDSIRKRVAAGFKMIMVDEFQDTNPLQNEITDKIDTGNLMMVGDENQSIFGFRDAEVGLFQEEDLRSEAGGYRIPLAENFRSQPEILAFVDGIFQHEDMLGQRYLKLEPRADIDPRLEECRVEVITVDTRPPEREKRLPDGEARQVEAQLIAERLHELRQEGYKYGDMAMLMATRKGAEIYRDALDRAGIPNYLAIGISFFNRQESGEIISMYRLLVNPLDDEALVAVLRSPLVGVSDDTLYWLRQAAGKDKMGNLNALWTVVGSTEALARFAAEDREKLTGFAGALKELRYYAARNSLQAVARRVIFFNDFAAAVAAGSLGKQALANLMKLVDLAAEYEASWGRDLAAFTEFLSHQKITEAKEADAPIEEEGVDSVRIMTMHSAKGLEFPLVVLPKLGARKGGRGTPCVLVDRDESSGRVGLKYTEPDIDKIPVFDYAELEAEKKQRDLEEEKRLIYVAMTRAERHLILVGYTAADKPASGTGTGSLPFDWIRYRLALDRANRPGLDDMARIDDIEWARVRLQVCTDLDAVLSRAEETTAVHDSEDLFKPVNAVAGKMPEPAIFVPAVISPTNLDKFKACPRRYFLDTVLDVGGLFDVKVKGSPAAEGCKLSATQMGTLVHYVLEHDLELAAGGTIAPEYLDAAAAELFGPETPLAQADYDRASALVARLGETTVAADLLVALKAGALKRELSFSMLVGKTIVGGFIDALCASEGGSLVVDYKTGSPGEGRTPEEAAHAYRYQMASYALAASRMSPGSVRVVLTWLGADKPVELTQEFSEQEAAALEEELNSVIVEMADGAFLPSDSAGDYQCKWCTGGPNGAGLCQGDRLV